MDVGDVQNVTWNDEAFTNLTMQIDRESLLLAFTKQKQVQKTTAEKGIYTTPDWRSGSMSNPEIGEGLIILLCGPPGVGKVMTAKSGNFGQLPFCPIMMVLTR